MPPQSSPRKDRAVRLVLSGEFDAKGAVEEVGLDAEAADGVCKRVRKVREKEKKERAKEEELRVMLRVVRTAKKKRVDHVLFVALEVVHLGGLALDP